MKIGEFEFNLRELGGSMGDFGTLIPFVVGYVLVNGFDPSGVLLMLGVTNIILALVYKLPLPVQPKKAVGSIAIAEEWPSHRIYGAGISLGIAWLLIGASKKLNSFIQKLPDAVIKGIQLGLGLILAIRALRFMQQDILLAIMSLLLITFFWKVEKFPAAIAVLLFGAAVAVWRGQLQLQMLTLGISFPSLFLPSPQDLYLGFLFAGIAQIPLTLTNAVVGTVGLIKEYFPEETVQPRSLILNMGAMNVVTPFLRGMPLCHGSGGLASQYFYGARTGGAIIMEGIMELVLGFFLAESIGKVFSVFPFAVLGAMLLFAGFELGRVASQVRGTKNILVMLVIAIASVITNIAVGFALGLLLYGFFDKIVKWDQETQKMEEQ